MRDRDKGGGVIPAVTRSVVELLAEGIDERTSADPEAVVLGSPADITPRSKERLAVSLSRIEPSGLDGSYQQGESSQTEETVVRKNPPLTLALRYLLTACPASDSRDVLAEHRLLEGAMGVLHDNPILDPAETHDGTPVRIALESSPSERTLSRKVCPEALHRPTVSYHVSPVVIESRAESRVGRVTERQASVSRSE